MAGVLQRDGVTGNTIFTFRHVFLAEWGQALPLNSGRGERTGRGTHRPNGRTSRGPRVGAGSPGESRGLTLADTSLEGQTESSAKVGSDGTADNQLVKGNTLEIKQRCLKRVSRASLEV